MYFLGITVLFLALSWLTRRYVRASDDIRGILTAFGGVFIALGVCRLIEGYWEPLWIVSALFSLFWGWIIFWSYIKLSGDRGDENGRRPQ